MLEVQVLVDASSGMLYLAVVNTGRGVARGSKYEIHALGKTASGILDDGFVLPGQKWRVVTSIGPFSSIGTTKDLGVAALVTHRDSAGFVHYTTAAGVTRTPKTLIRRRPRYDAGDRVFEKLCPGVGRHAGESVASHVEPAGSC